MNVASFELTEIGWKFLWSHIILWSLLWIQSSRDLVRTVDSFLRGHSSMRLNNSFQFWKLWKLFLLFNLNVISHLTLNMLWSECKFWLLEIWRAFYLFELFFKFIVVHFSKYQNLVLNWHHLLLNLKSYVVLSCTYHMMLEQIL